MFQNILVPLDFSEPSKSALRLAIRVARAGKGRITLLNVGVQPGFYMASPEIALPLVERYEEIAAASRHEAERLAREEIPEDVPWRVAMRDGYPPEAILTEATEGACDLIVMGTHGRTGIGHVLLGSVTERVLQRAKVPVLVTH